MAANIEITSSPANIHITTFTLSLTRVLQPPEPSNPNPPTTEAVLELILLQDPLRKSPSLDIRTLNRHSVQNCSLVPAPTASSSTRSSPSLSAPLQFRSGGPIYTEAGSVMPVNARVQPSTPIPPAFLRIKLDSTGDRGVQSASAAMMFIVDRPGGPQGGQILVSENWVENADETWEGYYAD